MKRASFQYKCRLCEVVFEYGETGDVMAVGHLIAAMNDADLPGAVGGTMRLFTVHHCDGNKVGVADLLGYVVKE